MKIKITISIILVTFLAQSCVETLTDGDDFLLTEGGKSLEIYIPKGISIKDKTKNINIYAIEKMIISGSVGGHNLSFLRSLAGGSDSIFLGGSNLAILDLKRTIFYSNDEVYYIRDNTPLKIKSTFGIPAYAFENCYVLSSIVLPDMYSPYNIEEGAFSGCFLLRYINWGRHVRIIKDEAFLDCSALAIGESLVLPDGVISIGNRAFKNTIPSSLDLPSSVESIEHEAFSTILGNVIIRAVNPPMIESDSFVFDKNSERILFVPFESIEKYQIEPYLSIFKEIKAL